MAKMMEAIKVTATVQDAGQKLGPQRTMSVVEVVEEICRQHPEYAGGKPVPDLIRIPNEKVQTFDKWLADIRGLFDAQKVSHLHGRIIILGLGLLEPRLRAQLAVDSYWKALEDDLKEPLETILTDQGHRLLGDFPEEPIQREGDSSAIGRSPEMIDSVPNHPDDPVKLVDADQLGRGAYARYLAKRLFEVPQERAYAVHIYGPWGAGKTTLLNFLKAELEAKDWLVVTFDAWRNQHIRPPWWALLDRVFQKAQEKNGREKRFLSQWSLFRERTWRMVTGRTHYFVGLFILASLTSLWLWRFKSTQNPSDPMELLVALADGIGTILATVVALWAAGKAVAESMHARSPMAAQTYLKTTRDPMGGIANRFCKLIERIKVNRVVIFIDDLDRCQSDYAVELLEGIQTIFREAPVIFVVAADQRWLNACFADVYQELEPHVNEPGKPLGTLFLEKVFQFATPVPGISEQVRRDFWKHLLHVKPSEVDTTAAQERAHQRIDNESSEEGMLAALEESHSHTFAYQQALREAMIVRMAAPEIVADIEQHTLLPFVHLLEPNPRSMKRLVNTYSVNRALSTLSRLDISQGKLALWTILSLRWPSLAEYLERDPENIAQIGQPNFTSGRADLDKLLKDPEVFQIVQGGEVAEKLDEDTIAVCALLRT